MTNTTEKNDRRYMWNLCMFTISFVISNLVSGIIYDVYVNYLQEVGRDVAVSFWSYYGYSAFISAALLLLIPKIGYKVLLMFCAVTCTAAIAAIKQAVSVPVLANGDVTTADEALTLLEATGCDGVMIGRGALGDPWLFAQVRAALLGEERPPEPTLNQRMTALRDQIYEMCEEKGEWAAMPQARSQAMHYMKGLRGAAALRRYCSMLEHFSDVDTLIEAVYRLQ